jgi:hypothetical protein
MGRRMADSGETYRLRLTYPSGYEKFVGPYAKLSTARAQRTREEYYGRTVGKGIKIERAVTNWEVVE